MIIDFKLTEWAPDLGGYNTNQLATANNVFAYIDGYRPVKTLEEFSDALSEPCLGAASFILADGSIFTFAGTDSGLFRLDGTSWTDVSKGGGYTTGDNRWRFVQWGNTVYATNYIDPIQKFDLKTDSQFSDMSATAPKCKDMAIVGEFLVLVNTDDTIDGVRENRIWWSPIGNPEGVWAVSSTTLSDFQDLVDGNFCVGIAGGDYGTILMENAIVKINFIGAPIVFQVQTIERVRGCIGIGAFTQNGRMVFFRSKDGFYVFDGAKSLAIGENKIDDFFAGNATTNAFDLDSIDKINCFYDRATDSAIWAYASNEAGGTYLDKWVIYNMKSNRWTSASFSEAEDGCEPTFVVDLIDSSFNLDQLDSLYTDLDSIPYSLDDDFFKGGKARIKFFCDDNKMYVSSGENKSGTIETSSIELQSGKRSFVNRIRMESDGSEHTFNISGTQNIFEDDNYSISETLINTRGSFSVRKDGRYHKMRISTLGTWDTIKSLQVEYRQGAKL